MVGVRMAVDMDIVILATTFKQAAHTTEDVEMKKFADTLKKNGSLRISINVFITQKGNSCMIRPFFLTFLILALSKLTHVIS